MSGFRAIAFDSSRIYIRKSKPRTKKKRQAAGRLKEAIDNLSKQAQSVMRRIESDVAHDLVLAHFKAEVSVCITIKNSVHARITLKTKDKEGKTTDKDLQVFKRVALKHTAKAQYAVGKIPNLPGMLMLDTGSKTKRELDIS